MARRCTSFVDAKGPSGVWFSFRSGYPVRWHQHHAIILWDYQDITAVIGMLTRELNDLDVILYCIHYS